MSEATQKPRRKPSASAPAWTNSLGMRILKPAVKPTHFTTAEIRKDIREIMAKRRLATDA